MVKDERKELITVSELRGFVLKLQHELEVVLIANACGLITDPKFELSYPCINLDWFTVAAKLLEDKGFIVQKDQSNLILKISVEDKK